MAANITIHNPRLDEITLWEKGHFSVKLKDQDDSITGYGGLTLFVEPARLRAIADQLAAAASAFESGNLRIQSGNNTEIFSREA